MGGEWRDVSIEEIASKIAMGPFGSDIKTDNFVPSGVPVIRGGNLTSGRFNGTDFVFLTGGKADQLANANAFPGDIVFTHRGTLGQVGLVPVEPFTRYVVSQSQMLLRCDLTAADPTFIYYFFKSDTGQHALLMNTSQTGVPAISRPTTSLKSIRLSLPPLPEQRAVAHILGTLDDKIELNRRMNETLEAMARALFKSWFVDFDPIRAKMNLPSPPGRGAGGEGTKPAIRANAPIPTQFLDYARQLRRQATDAENLLWRLLRGRQIANAKFRRQHSFPPYILDFYCHELKLAVELDGGQHNEEVGRRRDARRDEYLAGHGIRVLRFWNNDVLRETEAVLEAIYAAVVEHSGGVPSPPAPLPGGEGSCGLPKPLADLFPDSFEDSELGEIPRGWRLETLASIASLNPESWSRETRPDHIEYVDLSNTKWGRIEEVTSYAKEGVPSRAQRVLRPGDTIVGTVRPGNGSYALVSDDGLTGSTGFAVLRPLRAEYAEFVYLAATAADNIEALSHLADGAAYPAVRPEVVAATQVVNPTDEVAGRFSHVAGALLAKIAENDHESRTLAALRDTLLPKLISGELRVKDAEKRVEETA